MDLLNTVRKEGSRGGTGAFKWEDVQNSSHREHYLGHSINAPVGRWQKGRDLNWYARDANAEEGSAEQAAKERAEEIRKVKEAEEDALARALGLPVADRSNPNMEALGDKKQLDKLVKEGVNSQEGAGNNKGVGFGASGETSGQGPRNQVERIEGNADEQDRELHYALKEYKRRHGERTRRSRSRSRDPDRHRRHRKHRSRSRERGHHRRRSRSGEGGDRRNRHPRNDRNRSQRENRRSSRSRSPGSRSQERTRGDRYSNRY